MRIEQKKWTEEGGWKTESSATAGIPVHLVLIFGSVNTLKKQALFQEIQHAYPEALLFGCSTAGEICSTRVSDESLVTTAIHFEHSRLKGARTVVKTPGDSFSAGEQLARSLQTDGLRHVFVLSDGLSVNGSDLVKGITRHLPPDVAVTGGLSADGDRFKETFVIMGGPAASGTIALIGFYGDRLKIGYGSLGGWDSFGPERMITKSRGNVLFELDGKSALELYKKYLGEHAGGLPATGLLFPLSIRAKEGEPGLVRTILSVDEATRSMTFAGDMPEGAYARLMKANFNRLIEGAAGAARTSCRSLLTAGPELALLISCVGRKMVLKQRIEEEVEAVRDIVGSGTVLTGFYSYGEISPFTPGAACELHNQTMTITTLSETSA
ncbi:MAG: FIST C-terminal domain-containing protein [Deltaproteobacteria bacterium]|nr:FIST C-terminal domain-containing protein [Deltaproteobacteria bacterium]